MTFKRTKKLVSILTPCYNGARVIRRLLDSVLQQDYPYVEMIIVDDGSIDDSKNIINSYQDKFVNRGYSLFYIYQENKGQAAAINNGLKNVSGEYLIWPDCDDFFSFPSSISTFVNSFLKLDDEYGVVRCFANVLDEKDLHTLYVRKHNVMKERIFVEFFTCVESIAGAGLYMVRMDAFDRVNPSRDIYSEEKPQNWQLLLPILYSYKIYTIKKTLHNIVVNSHSHSREQKKFEEHIKGFDGYLSILIHTLDKIQMSSIERMRFQKICLIRNLLDKLDLSMGFYRRKDAINYVRELKKYKYRFSLAKKIKILVLTISPMLFRFIMKKYRAILK